MKKSKWTKLLIVLLSVMVVAIMAPFTAFAAPNPDDPIITTQFRITEKNDFPLRGRVFAMPSSGLVMNQEVELTAVPAEGYKLSKFRIYGSDGNEYQDSDLNLTMADENTATFKMPNDNLTVEGDFEWIKDDDLFDPHQYVKINFASDPTSGGTIQATQEGRNTKAEGWFHKNGDYTGSHYDDKYRIHIVATPASSKYEFVGWEAKWGKADTPSTRISIVDEDKYSAENKADAYLNIKAFNNSSHADDEVTVTATFKYNPDTVKYLDRWEGSEEVKTITEDEYSSFPNITGGTLTSGTYVVDRDITLNGRLVISGEVKLILMDGKTLNSPYGVTVTGSNTLYVYGQENETGKLIAGTAGNATSAALGGGYSQDSGTIHLCSGTVEAKVDNASATGAGIGGGSKGNAGNINIHGGNITANAGAGKYGAGIGGGDNGYGGTVTIWKGTVNATGGEFGAGIGSGDEPGSAPVMTVNIKGGNVTATGGDEAAGIGGGNEGNGATVNISGGTVTASGGNDSVGEGAGIGGGDEGDGGEVNISGGYVKATGGYRAAGIGGGADGSNTRTFITGGEVHAFGGGVKNVGTRQSGGAGIGGGAYGYGGVIRITGGDVEAKGVWGGAGIGGGYDCSVTNIYITGDDTKVSANADKGAAAIGGGSGGDVYNLCIAGGEVDALIIDPSSSEAGAAIGSGNGGYAANIAITGGTVKALSKFGNNGAAAIGGGYKGYFGNITIEGGEITSALAYGGAGIGSGAESEKRSEQSVAKITISGGTIRSGSVVAYNYLNTGAGIGSGSNAISPVHVEISGGTIDAYCGNDNGSGTLSASGAGIGSGYGSPMGLISISGGTIKATRGKGCTKADPIGHYNDSENSSAYYDVMTVYDAAQIRNEQGTGTDKRVTNTQYFHNAEISRKLALMENDSDWVEIKPCDHVGAAYEIVSAGEDGTHKMNCEYCLTESGVEHEHEFDESNQCACGYKRFKLTFKDGQENGKTTTNYVYPDLNSSGEVESEKEITISDYSPNPIFKVAGKELDGWKIQGDGDTIYKDDWTHTITADTTFIAQWNDLAGVKIVLSSIDGPVAQMSAGEFRDDIRIADILDDETVKDQLNTLIADQGDAYIVEKNNVGRPRYWASKPLSSFTSIDEFRSDLVADATVDKLDDDHTLYVAAFKPIDLVELSIKAPLCGTVTSLSGASSTNPPEFTVSEGADYSVVDGPLALLWLNEPAPDPIADGIFEGTMKGGTDYYALGLGIISANYGYVFTDNTGVALDGGYAEDKTANGQYLSITAKVTAVHDWTDWETVSPATCSAEGSDRRECKADSCDVYETRDIDIDPDAHDYGDPTYTWADDNSKVTAEAICSHNSDHKITETVKATASVIKDATCAEKGKTKYTAAFGNEIFAKQTKTLENIEPIGHDWGDPTYTWSDDNSKVTAEVVCNHNSEHKQTETVDTTATVIEKATCTEKGKAKYTAVFESDLFTEQTRTADIDATGHTPGTAVKEKVVAATCEKAGSYEAVVYCKACKKELSREKKTTKALGHKWGAWKVTKKATVDSKGTETRKCSVCGKEETRSIPKLKVSGTLIAKGIASGKKAIRFTWTKVNNASGYDVYLSRCDYKGKTYKPKKVKTIKGNKTFTWTKTGLAKNTCYKAYVRAYVIKNGSKTYVKRSPLIHVCTGNERKSLTNPKSIAINKKAVTLKKGKSASVKAKVTKVYSGLKLPDDHTTRVRYLSSDKKVATVSKSGKIKAKGKGRCYVYVYAQNGLWQKVKVTVK